jgi:MoaA/NifB/PqqE/SkfB family radical SAM enzyme
MPLEMIREVSTNFLQADLPLPQSTIILSGGEALLHPQFGEVCSIVRSLNGYIALSSNGILVPQYIGLFRRNDGIQISIDGNSRVHDFIRGAGSYENAMRALRLLDENNIRHSISFTANKQNLKCIDHIIDLCIETGSYLLNFNLYHPICENGLDPLSFSDWLSEKRRVKERVEQEGILCTVTCVEKGCIAGILGLSVLPDGTYWDCSRNQQITGRFPQKINDVLLRDAIGRERYRNQFETCCRRLKYA